MKLLEIGVLIASFCISQPLVAEKEPIKIECNQQAICTIQEIKTGTVLIGAYSGPNRTPILV